MTNDPVNKPHHYTTGEIECIDAIQASMSEIEFLGWLKGNVIKYQWRYRQKGGVEDIKKAQFYTNRMVAILERAAQREDAATEDAIEVRKKEAAEELERHYRELVKRSTDIRMQPFTLMNANPASIEAVSTVGVRWPDGDDHGS